MSADSFLSGNDSETPEDPRDKYYNEILRKDSEGRQEHKPLPAEVQEIVRTHVIRMAGFDEHGNFLGEEKLLEDLRTVHLIERDLVIDPVDVKQQLQRLHTARENTSVAHIDLQEISKFAALGGHANLNDIFVLLEMLKNRGYVLLLEYIVDQHRIPGGSIYGFSESFTGTSQSNKNAWQQRFLTLGLGNIAAPDEKVATLVKHKNKIVTNWRTSIPESFERLAQENIIIPPKLLTSGQKELRSPRLWGGGNALKRVVAAMGDEFDKAILMLNIGTIESVKELLGFYIPNIASDKYNSAFVDSTGYSRSILTRVQMETEHGEKEHVANIRWQIYMSLIESAIQRLDSDHGVLRTKGGWDIDKLDIFGRIIATLDYRKLRLVARRLQKDFKPPKRVA